MTNKISKKLRNLSLFLFAVMFIFAVSASAQTATITNSLDIGSSGADVTTLQTFLAKDSTVYPEGLVTGYYGQLTAAAVTKFQQRYGISAVGRVGPITRQKINELILSGGYSSGSSPSSSADAAPSISGVTNSTLTNSDGTKIVTLSWQTNESAKGKVFYSNSPLSFTETSAPRAEPYISGSVITDDTFGMTKSLNVSNLQSTSTYYYMIESIDTNGNVSVTWPNTINL